MKKTIFSAVLAATFGFVALAPQYAAAADGTITFNGKVTDVTCTITGGGAATGTGDITVQLPTVSASALPAGATAEGIEPFVNKALSRARLRRSIVVAACHVERALEDKEHDAERNWTDAVERFVSYWPGRWPLPYCVARISRLLQDVRFSAPVLPRPPLVETAFSALTFNLSYESALVT
jgi:hypothetical protein